jgi:hypothetical protein
MLDQSIQEGCRMKKVVPLIGKHNSKQKKEYGYCPDHVNDDLLQSLHGEPRGLNTLYWILVAQVSGQLVAAPISKVLRSGWLNCDRRHLLRAPQRTVDIEAV